MKASRTKSSIRTFHWSALYTSWPLRSTCPNNFKLFKEWLKNTLTTFGLEWCWLCKCCHHELDAPCNSLYQTQSHSSCFNQLHMSSICSRKMPFQSHPTNRKWKASINVRCTTNLKNAYFINSPCGHCATLSFWIYVMHTHHAIFNKMGSNLQRI